MDAAMSTWFGKKVKIEKALKNGVLRKRMEYEPDDVKIRKSMTYYDDPMGTVPVAGRASGGG
jgi:hypothetical protein